MDKKKVVIVGAGMAGLTAAAYLAQENCDVLLLEKNDRVGGLVGTFEYQGFSFDSGPRAFVNSGIIKPILKDLGIQWEFLANPISLIVEDEFLTIETMDSLGEYQAMLERLYPESRKEIAQIFKVILKLSKHTRVLYKFDNPSFGDVMSDKKFVIRELLPWTFKFLIALYQLNKFNIPMEDFLAKLSENQSMIDVLTQLFFRKTPTHFALGYFYVFMDYFYPRSGTGALTKIVEEKAISLGAEIKLNTLVTQVDAAKSQVVDSNRNVYPYDKLIWASDSKTLYRNLDSTALDKNIIANIQAQKKKVLAGKGAESVFILFLGIDRPQDYFAAKTGPHFFYTPSKEGLGETNRSELDELNKNFDKKSKEEILAWADRFLALNTFEVSIPALRDPALAPSGKTGIAISCLFDFALSQKIQKGGWYNEFKAHMQERIIALFSESLYKGIEKDIIFKFSSTPLTLNKVSGSSQGAITGWSFEQEPPAVNTLKSIPKSVLTPIPNVFQAGQWSYAPSGVPIAMLTGWYATQAIVKAKK